MEITQNATPGSPCWRARLADGCVLDIRRSADDTPRWTLLGRRGLTQDELEALLPLLGCRGSILMWRVRDEGAVHRTTCFTGN